VENNKKSCQIEDLSLHNNSNLDVDSNEEENCKENDEKNVIFFSERINEIVADLGDMI